MSARRSVSRLLLAIGTVSLATPLQAQFVYVANNISKNVSAYSIGATGVLSPIGAPVAAGIGPRSVAVDPTGRFVYVANGVSSNVSAYSIGVTGGLTPIGVPVAADGGPFSVAVDPTGRFVYTANYCCSFSVSAYSIGAT